MSIIAHELREGALVVALQVRRLDASVAATFRKEVVALLSDITTVILDLGQVDFIDSTGLGTFVAILKALPPSSQVRLAAPGPAVRKALELTRLTRVFSDFPSVSLAVAA